MQKAIRIGLNARSQAIKTSRAELKKTRKRATADYERWAERCQKEDARHVKAERLSRRTDFLDGPLAADRDTSLQRGKYGTISNTQMMRAAPPAYVMDVPQEKLEEPLPGVPVEWSGEGNEGNIVVGDRVCIIRGREGVKGKIGTVKTVDLEKSTLTVGDVNMADVEIPAYMSSEERSTKLMSVAGYMMFNDVRLVVRQGDEDVVVRYLKAGAPFYEREHYSNIPRHTRYIAGTDVEVEWPEPEIQDQERESADTARRDVEDVTYTPEVMRPPLPFGVMDELYNKYEVGRTRHDDNWIAQKIVEDARSLWYEKRHLLTQEKQMRRPLKERMAEEIAIGNVQDWKQTWQQEMKR